MIDLNNKTFRAEINSGNGEVSGMTRFHYHQDGQMIWADYHGGQIVRGHLIGTYRDGQLDFVYHHLNMEQEVRTGICKSFPELTADGKIRLREEWQWTSGDGSRGTSVLIEE